MNSLRMSFWIVPESFSRRHALLLRRDDVAGQHRQTAPFMVIDTLILSSGMPANRIFMSSTESIATPALPTSPDDAGVVAVVAAVGGEVEGDRDAHLPAAARFLR